MKTNKNWNQKQDCQCKLRTTVRRKYEKQQTKKNGIWDACSTVDCCPLLSIIVHCCPMSIVVHCFCGANNQNVSDRATYGPLTLVHVGPESGLGGRLKCFWGVQPSVYTGFTALAENLVMEQSVSHTLTHVIRVSFRCSDPPRAPCGANKSRRPPKLYNTIQL